MSIFTDNQGKFLFKSFNTGHQGDAFQMWADFYGLDCTTQFKEVLAVINQEMCLGLDSDQDIKVIPKPVLPKLSLDKNQNSLYLLKLYLLNIYHPIQDLLYLIYI